MFTLFGKSKKQVEQTEENKQGCEKGRQAANDVNKAIKEYVEARLPHFRKQGISVLRSQLDSIFDDVQKDPRLMARRYLTLFLERLEEVPSRVTAQLAEASPDTVEFINILNEPEHVASLEDLVRVQLDPALAEIFTTATTMAVDEIIIIDQGMKHGRDAYEGSAELAAVTKRLMGKNAHITHIVAHIADIAEL